MMIKFDIKINLKIKCWEIKFETKFNYEKDNKKVKMKKKITQL
jgi:hypothetical protein